MICGQCGSKNIYCTGVFKIVWEPKNEMIKKDNNEVFVFKCNDCNQISLKNKKDFSEEIQNKYRKQAQKNKQLKNL